MPGLRSTLTRLLALGGRAALAELERRSAAPRRTPDTVDAARERPRPRRGGASAVPGRVQVEYAPRADGHPDPGEVVWTWVPYEEDDGRGKDRPVLIVGRTGADLVGLMLTSKDHDGRPADGRSWVDVGTGAWDRQGRPSEVRVDRVLTVSPAQVRREGSTLPRERFDEVVAEARRVNGW
ncbi:type II toxin-antitoxin system PemK/MazF family toxin [Kineococcus rubinsiae]|uniref:type II toxin-antitoxin system PemK/MazF family toxin n=1 Tax=Kineococcus rubinsiae TaxID=2609562 RepID=UPI0014304E8A|nr:type II toxin-antitoxin system PemK/MazF family toxin [Kineococcus rubinsiae]NIZ89837.1 type II toxin-antitoxin system PemK/MazF family toxin [Kineococcus rubinsiae]